mgnify:FL=1|tara:strand:+ start:509 stop:772 length:264 start_codon:yes stop_codon:yes gene_type:complete
MLNWLKNFLNPTPPLTQSAQVKSPVVDTTVSTTSKSVAKPVKSTKISKAKLSQLTKVQLEEKGRELGIELDRRLLKAKLVDQVHKAQ